MEIGLFPLGMVLLPTERVPLHIFEPRYKELIGECLDEGREFGLVLADDDGLREIGTRAAVVEVAERFPDGRLNVIVEGHERFRLLELTSKRSFLTGEVERVEDEEPEFGEDALEAALTRFRELGQLAGADVETLEVSTPTPSFELAARVELEPRLKQALLELRSEPQRLRTLAELLERARKALERQHELARIAAMNGKARDRRKR